MFVLFIPIAFIAIVVFLVMLGVGSTSEPAPEKKSEDGKDPAIYDVKKFRGDAFNPPDPGWGWDLGGIVSKPTGAAFDYMIHALDHLKAHPRAPATTPPGPTHTLGPAGPGQHPPGPQQQPPAQQPPQQQPPTPQAPQGPQTPPTAPQQPGSYTPPALSPVQPSRPSRQIPNSPLMPSPIAPPQGQLTRQAPRYSFTDDRGHQHGFQFRREMDGKYTIAIQDVSTRQGLSPTLTDYSVSKEVFEQLRTAYREGNDKFLEVLKTNKKELKMPIDRSTYQQYVLNPDGTPQERWGFGEEYKGNKGGSFEGKGQQTKVQRYLFNTKYNIGRATDAVKGAAEGVGDWAWNRKEDAKDAWGAYRTRQEAKKAAEPVEKTEHWRNRIFKKNEDYILEIVSEDKSVRPTQLMLSDPDAPKWRATYEIKGYHSAGDDPSLWPGGATSTAAPREPTTPPSAPTVAEPEKKRGWFSRLFGRKEKADDKAPESLPSGPRIAYAHPLTGKERYEVVVTGDTEQGLGVLEVSTPPKSENKGSVYTRTYVPVSKGHVLRIEDLAANLNDIAPTSMSSYSQPAPRPAEESPVNYKDNVRGMLGHAGTAGAAVKRIEGDWSRMRVQTSSPSDEATDRFEFSAIYGAAQNKYEEAQKAPDTLKGKLNVRGAYALVNELIENITEAGPEKYSAQLEKAYALRNKIAALDPMLGKGGKK